MSIPHHGTSESCQAEASGVQRFLASLFPHTSSSLAHFAHWIYTIPLKLPLNLELSTAVLKPALTPLSQCTQCPSQPIIQRLTQASSSKSTRPHKRRVGCNSLLLIHLPTLPAWWHSHSGGLLSSGGKERRGQQDQRLFRARRCE